GIKGSEPVEAFGFEGYVEPEPVKVDLEGMIELFKTGFQQFSALWKEIFCEACFDEIRKTAEMDPDQFHLSTEAWIQILYELAATFHSWTINRYKLVDLMTPIYFARVASFVRQSWEMSSLEAENLVEEQALKFEEQKDYLLKMWDQKPPGNPEFEG
ncbi:MAG: glycosyl transferase family 2, partial [Desulfobacteraceae bacterium]|nr:glycosyl transferase family 2 [Desulfobacteraceae bacterium]